MSRHVPFSEYGIPVGEHHHRAKLSDDVVKQMRDLHEFQGWGQWRISRHLGISRGTVSKIIYYTRRNVVPREWRKVADDDK